MDERARKILSEAWENIDRIDAMQVREREPTFYDAPPPRVPVERRKRTLDTTPEQRQRLREEAQAESDAAFNAWFDRRFHERLAEYMTEYSETVVKVTFQRLDAHKHALETEIRELRNELNVLREVRSNGNVREITRKSDVVVSS